MEMTTRRRRFTVDEYYRMAEAGILKPEERLELLDGQIVESGPVGSRHAAWDSFLNHFFFATAGERAGIRVRNPVRLDDASELQPDLMLLRPRADFYISGHPGPSDVLLLIEVADSSADSDREVKAPLYARTGVAEYWLLLLAEKQLILHRDPAGGRYTSVKVHGPGATPSPAAFPEIRLPLDQLP